MANPEHLKIQQHRGAVQRSRRMIQDSRALMADVQGVLRQACESLARQRYRQIVCAWCKRTVCWQRGTEAPWSVSLSLCYDCFAGVFQELPPGCRSPAGIPLMPRVL
jgi:hypothetical protein